jgi:release factor glutamine methyltransferase
MHAALSPAEPVTVDQLLMQATAALRTAGAGTPRLDAEMLLAAACGLDRTALYVRARDGITSAAQQTFHTLLMRRLAREPLQYIVGHQEFWSLDFMVTPSVLIPRPETELVVELTIAATRDDEPIAICDLGTGSGCLAVALARELPAAQIWAVDVSPAALAVARANAQRHRVADRIHFLESDLFSLVSPQRFDVIACNPPYIDTTRLDSLQPELRYEPRRALDGGERGLDVVRSVIESAPDYLRADGWLMMEIGADQGPMVAAMARERGFAAVAVRADYAAMPRVLRARR